MSTALRVLLVEDNPGDARLIQDMLEQSWGGPLEITIVERAGQVRDGFDVVLLDLSLPDSHGLETFRRAREKAGALPILVLTGHDDDQVAVEAVRQGAQDYLVKGRFDGDLLARAIRYAQERQELLTRLRETDRLKNLFLSVVSHDLKNPAAAILAAVDMVLGEQLGPLTDKQRHALTMVRRNAARQGRLVRDLLDVSAIEGGKLVVDRELTELGALLRAGLDEMESLALERDIELDLEVPKKSVWAWVERDRVLQVVTNLVGNALRFAQERVSVRLEPTPEQIRILVRDDGPGVPDDLLQRLFERYVRGHDAAKGSGLGLFIVRGIIEAHGGWVRVRNLEKGGACFEVGLPNPAPRRA